jgi:hypothetical protein
MQKILSAVNVLKSPFYNITVARHDGNPRFSKSLSRINIYYSRLIPIISHLLIINTMLPTR